MTNVQTGEGVQLFANFLDEQISLLIRAEGMIRKSELPRVVRLHALYAAIIEDSISIRFPTIKPVWIVIATKLFRFCI